MDYINILWQSLVWICSFVGLIISAIFLYYEFKQGVSRLKPSQDIQKDEQSNNVNTTKDLEK